jgi:hypothetical protein
MADGEVSVSADLGTSFVFDCRGHVHLALAALRWRQQRSRAAIPVLVLVSEDSFEPHDPHVRVLDMRMTPPLWRVRLFTALHRDAREPYTAVLGAAAAAALAERERTWEALSCLASDLASETVRDAAITAMQALAEANVAATHAKEAVTQAAAGSDDALRLALWAGALVHAAVTSPARGDCRVDRDAFVTLFCKSVTQRDAADGARPADLLDLVALLLWPLPEPRRAQLQLELAAAAAVAVGAASPGDARLMCVPLPPARLLSPRDSAVPPWADAAGVTLLREHDAALADAICALPAATAATPSMAVALPDGVSLARLCAAMRLAAPQHLACIAARLTAVVFETPAVARPSLRAVHAVTPPGTPIVLRADGGPLLADAVPLLREAAAREGRRLLLPASAFLKAARAASAIAEAAESGDWVALLAAGDGSLPSVVDMPQQRAPTFRLWLVSDSGQPLSGLVRVCRYLLFIRAHVLPSKRPWCRSARTACRRRLRCA